MKTEQMRVKVLQGDADLIRSISQESTLEMQDIAGALLHAAAEYVKSNGGKMEIPFKLNCCGEKRGGGGGGRTGAPTN